METKNINQIPCYNSNRQGSSQIGDYMILCGIIAILIIAELLVYVLNKFK